MIQQKKEKKRKDTKTTFSLNAIANKNRILLTPGNI